MQFKCVEEARSERTDVLKLSEKQRRVFEKQEYDSLCKDKDGRKAGEENGAIIVVYYAID